MARKKASSKKKYGSAASKSVEREMKAYKKGKLKSGRSGAKVKVCRSCLVTKQPC